MSVPSTLRRKQTDIPPELCGSNKERGAHTAPRQEQGSHAAAVQLALLLIQQHTKGAAQDWKNMHVRGQCRTIM